MSDVNSIAAFSAAHAAAKVNSEIGIKVLKMINQQQQSVASLIETAVESAEQVAASTGGGIDIQA